MAYSFDKQAAVITGAGSGIGLEIARQLALQGAGVVLNDIDTERAEAAAERIRAEGGQCLAFPGNMADLDRVGEMVAFTLERFGQIDMAIANAGLTRFSAFLSMQPADFQAVVDLNLKGTFFLSQAVARHMRDRGEGGRLLIVSSITGLQPHPELSAYSMTKAALNMLIRSLVLELAPYRIRVNGVAPGATLTERTLQDDPNYESVWRPLVPDGRIARPADIAEAALFLLSPSSDHINGQTLVVDGGWLATGQHPGFTLIAPPEGP